MPMSVLLDNTSTKAEGSKSVVGFEQPAYEDGSEGWNRYLTLEGERAYFIGGACDTCAFLFERMGGADRNVSPEQAANALRGGLRRIDDALVGSVAGIVPRGTYRVNLLERVPTLVAPGAEGEHFAHQQAELEATDAF